jgi:hypothetical protein
VAVVVYAALCYLALALWLPDSLSAQSVDRSATPVFFVRSTTTVDAQMRRAANGATLSRRALAERLTLTARSRGPIDVRAHATFDYWFDAGDVPPGAEEGVRQLEPALQHAWVDLQWRSLTLRVGRQDTWGILGFARVDGISIAWRESQGLHARLTAGVRNQPSRWRLDRWDYTPLGDPLEHTSSGVPAAALAEAELGWRGRRGGLSTAIQQRWRGARASGSRLGVDAWATPVTRLRLWVGATGDTSIAGVSSVELGLRRRGDRTSFTIDARAMRPLFEPSSTWMVFPISATARLRASMTHQLGTSQLTISVHLMRRYLRSWARPGAESAGGSMSWSRVLATRLSAGLSASADAGAGVRWGVGRGRLSYECTRRVTLHATQVIRATASERSSRRARALGSVSQLTAIFAPDQRTTLAASSAITSDTRDGVGWQLFVAADLQLPSARW